MQNRCPISVCRTYQAWFLAPLQRRLPTKWVVKELGVWTWRDVRNVLQWSYFRSFWILTWEIGFWSRSAMGHKQEYRLTKLVGEDLWNFPLWLRALFSHKRRCRPFNGSTSEQFSSAFLPSVLFMHQFSRQHCYRTRKYSPKHYRCLVQAEPILMVIA